MHVNLEIVFLQSNNGEHTVLCSVLLFANGLFVIDYGYHVCNCLHSLISSDRQISDEIEWLSQFTTQW
jgi:hypothetical protein